MKDKTTETKDLKLSISLKSFEDIKHADKNGTEYWEARELMPLLQYNDWRNFYDVIKKAEISCSKSEQVIENHFGKFNKTIIIAKGSPRETNRKIDDYKLSRYACYLIAQNGDSSKEAIAKAQTYFAIQTRKQEMRQQIDEDNKRLDLRGKLDIHNKQLYSLASNAGVKDLEKFDDSGYLGLYGMHKKSIQKKKGIGKDDILDRAGASELGANIFRITQAEEKIERENIKGQGQANFAHIVVGQKVRKAIAEIGGAMPEDLPAKPHIKEIENKKKKLLNNGKTKKIKSI